jgi:DNA mismatch endonuclease (patch repair protein)
MSRIRSEHTKPELLLKKYLHGAYLRYHPKGIICNPDFASKSLRIAVFVDGNFWHGYNWKVKHKIPPKGFWQKKILRNMKRDIRYTKLMRQQGWKVIRLWEHQILTSPKYCAEKVKMAIRGKKFK